MAKLSVLVVDDEKEVCDFLERFLTSEGYFVRTIHDPTQAEKELRENKFNVIMLDLNMPGMSGLDLLRAVRVMDKDIFTVIITGNPSVETAMESIEYGISAYLRKPFTLNEIRNVLERIASKVGLSEES